MAHLNCTKIGVSAFISADGLFYTILFKKLEHFLCENTLKIGKNKKKNP